MPDLLLNILILYALVGLALGADWWLKRSERNTRKGSGS
jgi:hypothetical protein